MKTVQKPKVSAALLSILIPIFDFDVRPLVAGLHMQCTAAGLAFEILCFDDGSQAGFKKNHRGLAAMEGVEYREMPANLGRSGIRNALGKAARYEWLLFLDCDSGLVGPHYVQYYLDHLAPGTLVYGGRCYADAPPADPRLFFHWKYGRQREQTSAAQREAAPWHSFMTNNFLVPKQVFLEVLFDEALRQYGHEDTLFGLELAKRQVAIRHIDNPLEHLGLEPAATFLHKTRQGLQNLHALWRRGTPIDTRLLRAFEKCRSLRLAGPLGLAFPLFQPLFLRHLTGSSPNLAIFDFYKLLYLAWYDRTHRAL